MYQLPKDKNETNCLLAIDFACYFRKNRSQLGDRMAIVDGTDIESRRQNSPVAGF